MSRSIERLRARKADWHGEGLDALGAEGDANMYANLAAMLAKGGGEIASNVQAKKEAERKATAARDLEPRAKDARSRANAKADEARTAALKAQTEQEPYGPLHVTAQNLAREAAEADAEARRLETELAQLRGLPPPQQQMMVPTPSRPWYDKVPWWGWGLGAGALGTGAYLLLRRSR